MGMNEFIIPDLEFDALPGGTSQPVVHVPAVRVVIAVIALLWPTEAK